MIYIIFSNYYWYRRVDIHFVSDIHVCASYFELMLDGGGKHFPKWHQTKPNGTPNQQAMMKLSVQLTIVEKPCVWRPHSDTQGNENFDTYAISGYTYHVVDLNNDSSGGVSNSSKNSKTYSILSGIYNYQSCWPYILSNASLV